MRASFTLPLLALFLAITALALADPTTQMMHNGSFESWTTPLMPDQWVLRSGTVAASTTQIDGLYSAQFHVKKDALLGGYSASMSQTVPFDGDAPIAPEAYYDLSFDTFANFNNGRGWSNATIYWYGQDGSNYATTIIPLTMIETPEFRHYSVLSQAPVGVANIPMLAKVEFNLGSTSNGPGVTMWLDGVEFGLGPT